MLWRYTYVMMVWLFDNLYDYKIKLYIADRTNKSIIDKIKVDTILLTRIRRNINSMERTYMVNCKRPQGRCHTRWIDEIKALTGYIISVAFQIANNRVLWRRTVIQLL